MTDSEFQSAASHATDFDPPIYNVWKQQEKSPDSWVEAARDKGRMRRAERWTFLYGRALIRQR
jgi:hypothetical protein